MDDGSKKVIADDLGVACDVLKHVAMDTSVNESERQYAKRMSENIAKLVEQMWDCSYEGKALEEVLVLIEAEGTDFTRAWLTDGNGFALSHTEWQTRGLEALSEAMDTVGAFLDAITNSTRATASSTMDAVQQNP